MCKGDAVGVLVSLLVLILSSLREDNDKDVIRDIQVQLSGYTVEVVRIVDEEAQENMND